MKYRDALAYLERYTNYERELRYPYDGWAMNIERVRMLLDGLGRPDQGLRIVHLAGTKGKGSTAAMLEGMVREAGFSTGLFTSPHLLDLRERIRLSGEMMPKRTFSRWVERIIPAAEKVHKAHELGPLTYFEVMTALAVASFAGAGVDLAILEAGLGGRYDATTVCDPVVSVLTHVSLDHTDILGSTIEAIAEEKAMIIKPGSTAVVAPQDKSAQQVIDSRCRTTGAGQVRVEESYSWQPTEQNVPGQWVRVRGNRQFENLFIPIPGEPQRINAVTAMTAADLISKHGLDIPDKAIEKGLAGLRWPARFQRTKKNPDLVLDGAHNQESARHLRETLQHVYPGRKVTAILGLGKDKDVEGFLTELGPALSKVLITRSRTMKAADPERIEVSLAPLGVEVARTSSVAEAMELAAHGASAEEVILVTGSFYVISEAMQTTATSRDLWYNS